MKAENLRHSCISGLAGHSHDLLSYRAKRRHQQHPQQLRERQREGNISYLQAVVETQPHQGLVLASSHVRGHSTASSCSCNHILLSSLQSSRGLRTSQFKSDAVASRLDYSDYSRTRPEMLQALSPATCHWRAPVCGRSHATWQSFLTFVRTFG